MTVEDNRIICRAYPVKYRRIEYGENYVTIEQNRTRRRVPKGYYFEDTGAHIYVSSFYADIFQHKSSHRLFYLDKETKEWEALNPVEITTHRPTKHDAVESNIVEELKV